MLIEQVWIFQFCIFRGHRLKFLNSNIFLLLKIVCILAKSADPGSLLFANLVKYMFAGI